MSSFVHKETTQTLAWLDFYGVLRESGANAFNTQKFLDQGGDALAGAIATMSASAGADDAERVQQAETAGEVIMGLGTAALVIPVVGEILGAILIACGAIITFLAKYFVIECDKYHCEGYDQKTETQRNIYKSHQRTLVGVFIPDSWELHAESDCSCNHNYHHCSFIRYMHDGLVIDGIEYATATEGSKTKVGRVRGANGIASGGNAGCVEFWRNHAASKPLNASGADIPKGSHTSAEDAYKNDRNDYYYRAWKVRHILSWMQKNVLCRTMECMEKVLLNTSKTPDDSEFNQKRRRGSRWYLSIVLMMKDVWQYGQRIGWAKVEEILKKVGASAEALDALKKMKRGDASEQKDIPWEWWPLTSKLTFNQLRAALIEMKPLFPYEPNITKAMPEGQAAREQSMALKPLMLPIRTAIMYGGDMKPVPAKTGSRGPGAGTIAIGVGAALVGGYAIYKIVSKD